MYHDPEVWPVDGSPTNVARANRNPKRSQSPHLKLTNTVCIASVGRQDVYTSLDTLLIRAWGPWGPNSLMRPYAKRAAEAITKAVLRPRFREETAKGTELKAEPVRISRVYTHLETVVPIRKYGSTPDSAFNLPKHSMPLPLKLRRSSQKDIIDETVLLFPNSADDQSSDTQEKKHGILRLSVFPKTSRSQRRPMEKRLTQRIQSITSSRKPRGITPDRSSTATSAKHDQHRDDLVVTNPQTIPIVRKIRIGTAASVEPTGHRNVVRRHYTGPMQSCPKFTYHSARSFDNGALTRSTVDSDGSLFAI
ncbi:hypothetical protein EJ05DRAFT_499532 [Pseudovirgaria hyperparasitica]|uniref:Uncharacterized protein n=1 Tax=Pseudovirgaria hyperparasitica TaxID=470096 RepID=A0A6A6WC08_9PEZI|nr:uncharacterized protein EJ05DRAFT_499532 [Pseudovirgaria hyperparasitica]KAF2759107.1 hypothetical protein EJ05DRAFT_499532 [Pseudovirgaria hyperparasitica]